MKKMKFKEIVGGILLVFLMVFCFFSYHVVFAKDDKKKEDPRDDLPTCNDPSESWGKNMKDLAKYGFNVSGGEGTTVDISMNPVSSDSTTQAKLREAVFDVSVNGTSTGKQVKYDSSLTVDTSFVNNEMVIDLVTEKSYKDPDCNGNVHIKYVIEHGGTAFDTTENVEDVPDESLDGSESKAINCDKPKNEFEQNFCYAKKKAQKTAVYSKKNNKRINFTDKFNDDNKFDNIVGVNKGEEDDDKKYKYSTFKCDYKKVYTSEQLKSNYYVNKKYLYGSGVHTLTSNKAYAYHYSPGVPTKGDTPSCKVECEEAVVVEYGPPIASKAGLCFEYKIKVTSRVSCNMSEKPVTPKVLKSYCTPTPWCTNAAGTYTVNQGGPNEEFDSCIQSCDGGKYTDKCSQKCYKEVYGNSSGSASKVSVSRGYKIEKLADKVETTINTSPAACAADSSYGGCYYKDGSTIKWYGVKSGKSKFFSHGSDRFVPGRWYVTGGWAPGAGRASYAVFQDDGFKRHIYTGGEYCHDSCWWSGCSGDVYLNPGQSALDQKENKAIYKEIVSKCKAAASCNTSTAEFTISVDYLHKNSEGKTEQIKINFPYSTPNSKDKDELTSRGEGVEKPNNTSSKENSTILGYGGCYKSKEEKNWYQTEWSFPGSWINNKTGEVSYAKKDADSGWKAMTDKFCIPLDAMDVNQDWWNYYYAKTMNLKGTSVGSSSFEDKCKSYSTTNSIISPATKDTIKVDKWNITGKAIHFGYFKWNLQFKCFYALNSNPTNMKTSSATKDVINYCVNKEPKYRIRSVDLNNMFPATDGSTTPAPSKSGRTPGFNWTDYADNGKNSNYLSYPSKYMEQVQSKGYSIYSKNYLDYQFELTPEILRKMRQTTKKNDANYTEFSGTSAIGKDGVIHYTSKRIRSGALGSAKSKIPRQGSTAISCNNMINHENDSSCASHIG